jgi:uncharacterized integral membrane protein
MNFLKKWLFRIVLFVVFVVALLAASDNSQEVPLTFLDYQTPAWPVSWWMLLAFVVGVGFGLMLNFVSNTKLRMDARKASKTVAKTSKELDEALAQPADGSV